MFDKMTFRAWISIVMLAGAFTSLGFSLKAFMLARKTNKAVLESIRELPPCSESK
jgi:hypothetical protein